MKEGKWPTFDKIVSLPIEELENLLKKDLPGETWALVASTLLTDYSNSHLPEKMPPLLEQFLAYGIAHNDKKIHARAYLHYSSYYKGQHQFTDCFKSLEKATALAKELEGESLLMAVLTGTAAAYSEVGMASKAHELIKEVYNRTKESTGKNVIDAFNLGQSYYKLGEYEKALPYLKEGLQLSEAVTAKQSKLNILSTLASTYTKLEQADEALDSANKLAHWAEVFDIEYFKNGAFFHSSQVYLQQGMWQQAYDAAIKAYPGFKAPQDSSTAKKCSLTLYRSCVELKRFEEATTYADQHLAQQDSWQMEEGKKIARNFDLQIEMERREAQHQKELGEARLKTLAMLANEMAHEIQNPLNFVNNFSEVNGEMIDEILASHSVEEIHEIATDLKSNATIILDHGKRISKIVTELQDKTQKAKSGELELVDEDEHDFSGKS